MRQRDPLANPRPLIRRVYSYVAYRIGDGPDAEDVTSEVFERALRYRASYDESRGQPVPWLLGGDAVRRLTVATAVSRLDERARDLLALRYGADLSARQIGEILGLKTNAVEVALHRTLARVRNDLQEAPQDERSALAEPSPRIAP